MSTRITNAMRTLLASLGIDPSASTPPNLGSESDTASATGSAFAQINKLQTDVGALISEIGALDARVTAIEGE